ncbi:Protein of unknown function, putative, partial [Plasmodium vivax]
FPKSLEIVYAHDKRWNLKFKRLLARNVQNRELEHTRLRVNLPDIRAYKSESIVYDELSTYPRVKGKASKNIDTYMKNYKNRYMKKKGLSKLDCYYENKIFGKFCNIRDIAKNMQYDKKRSKKFLYRKYGIGLFLFALLPAIGLIFPILFGVGKNPGALGLCIEDHFDPLQDLKHKSTKPEHINCDTKWLYEKKDLIYTIGYVNWAFSIITVTTILLVFIYIIAKVIKYDRIKSGKGKMKGKVYIKHCKEVF